MNKINLYLILFFISIYLGQCDKTYQMQKRLRNSTDTRNRNGRHLIFNRGGSLRVVCGFLAPTFIPKWQNINCLTNWSVGFNCPSRASDWYDKFKGNINFQQYRSRELRDHSDSSRNKFYSFLEENFNRWGRNGRECLLRTICEVAEAPIIHNGLLGELFHVIFTPGNDENVLEEYKIAKRAGYHGANCTEIFSNCPYGHGILEKYSVLGLFTSKNFLSYFIG